MMTEALILLAVVAVALLVFGGKAVLYRNRKKTGWVIGPILPDGRNTSKGYPERPETGAGFVCAFDFVPGGYNHVHYLTRDREPINGATLIVEYEFEAADGVRFASQEGNGPAWITPFIQRSGDDFTAMGDMTYYRWWANVFTTAIEPGRATLSIPLQSKFWCHTMGVGGDDFFRTALASNGRWGVTFGGPTGLGHGVYSTGPARFTLHRMEVVA